MPQSLKEPEPPAKMHRHEGARYVLPGRGVDPTTGERRRDKERERIGHQQREPDPWQQGKQWHGSEPGDHQHWRGEMPGPERVAMKGRDADLATSIAHVLPEQIADRLAAVPADRHRRIEQQPVASLT